ncbi:Uncharacterized [Syntrophomonas zehnderi OL-4]|uniref:Uncharacterized n=1 Tax=Syntrophomonas zehnderi OL-4 TaxID=690567 RepID=A0A0E4GAC8_9FIRM|nr:hypothetical protein [Syntrophomonas zehnderi]CFX09740.1 Uncharacterized [Syntrophomonas zehnderi OL-4]
MNTRIPRPDKDRMRAQLEEVLRQQKAWMEKIEAFQMETKAPDYQAFWADLNNSYVELNNKISRYMVRKCNR